jgi:hypothetical protein
MGVRGLGLGNWGWEWELGIRIGYVVVLGVEMRWDEVG